MLQLRFQMVRKVKYTSNDKFIILRIAFVGVIYPILTKIDNICKATRNRLGTMDEGRVPECRSQQLILE